jgi:hypothetical protein
MIINAIKTSLSNPTNVMSEFVGRVKVKKFQQEIQNPDLTMDELQIILLEVVQMKYVQRTGPPYLIKYHAAFLNRFQGNIEQDQPKAQSQETKTLNNKDQHLDNESMIVPPNIQNTTTPPTEPYIKRPRTDELEDAQTTLTQIWTPRPTQVLSFETEANDKQQDNDELTEIEHERRRKLVAITNPYSQSKQQWTPIVPPHKTCTHAKPKSVLDTPRTNLKDPPAPTPCNIRMN